MTSRIVVALAVGVAALTAEADNIYVDDDNCPGPGDGTIENPYCSIQDAIDSAVDSDEIVVAPGTYFETINFLGKAIRVYSTDGPDLTIIDAQQTGTVVTCDSAEGPNSVLEGFTITGGYTAFYGAGMRNINSSPTVTNCTFSGNTAQVSGGGMYNTNGNPTVTECAFIGNSAVSNGVDVYGGGMYNENSNPTVTNCTFFKNLVYGVGFDNAVGGGMYNFKSSPTVSDCMFIMNRADAENYGASAGGMSNRSNSNPLVTRCSFIGNWAYSAGGISNSFSSPNIIDCVFIANSGPDGQGAMGNGYGSITVANCTFVGNHGRFGDGIGNFWSSPTVTNCMLISDRIYNHGSSNPTVTNCILWGSSFGGSGSPIVSYSDVEGGYDGEGNIDADPRFVSGPSGTWTEDASFDSAASQTTFTDSNASFVSGELAGKFVKPDTSPPYYLFEYLIVANTATTITVWGNHTSLALAGDVYQIHDYHLSPGSPCIDAGNNWGVPMDENDYDEDSIVCELFPVDLDGKPRFNADEADFDPGCGVPVVVDMGAYEYQFDPADQVTFADLNGDNVVGAADLLGLLASWGPCAKGCCLADLDIDGSVGASDLLFLLANWGACP